MASLILLSLAYYLIQLALCGPATESYKGQYCTDPRTMRKHAAYTEWADAYSCTRHRCQPGGRNLAIYTVGCKRVEAPESAIECEEVVEDTNMQFPYCCTRLRCLVVVRGEVWTRVLGQPWEALPAAPWSHMYKMKRPPPVDGTFLPKTPDAGPIYELADTEKQEKVLRSKSGDDATDCNEVAHGAAPAPDIVIALSTNPKDDHKMAEEGRPPPKYLALSAGHRRNRKPRVVTTTPSPYFEEAAHESDTALDIEDFPTVTTTEKAPAPALRADTDASSDETFANSFGVTQKTKKAEPAPHSDSWTEIPTNQWNEHDPGMDADSKLASDHEQDLTWTLPDLASSNQKEQKEPPPSNLQALVDAIGTRMRDIESVVQRMSDKVHDATPEVLSSGEKRSPPPDAENHKKRKTEPKKTTPGSEHYKRFADHSRGGSKYLHATETTTDVPLFLEDKHVGGGYFSDASNSVLRRSNAPKEPAQTYMAPVETRRKHAPSDTSSDDEGEKKHKKHGHKKKKSKHGHKKHHSKEEKRKRFNKISSAERENVVSLEDSSAVAR